MNADVTVEIENDTLENEGEKRRSDGTKTFKEDLTAPECFNCLLLHAPIHASVLHRQMTPITSCQPLSYKAGRGSGHCELKMLTDVRHRSTTGRQEHRVHYQA